MLKTNFYIFTFDQRDVFCYIYTIKKRNKNKQCQKEHINPRKGKEKKHMVSEPGKLARAGGGS